MKRRAFTLVELLVVLAIISVVAAILTPTFGAVRRKALVSATAQDAHQLSLALLLYRTDQDGDGKWGRASEMGLPTPEVMYNTLPLEKWRTTCHYPPRPPEDPFGDRYFAYWVNDDDGLDKWPHLSRIYQDASPLIITVNCTDPQWDIDNPFHPKLGIGVDLTGTILRKNRIGKWFRFSWWLD